jgi:hypothetical protein
VNRKPIVLALALLGLISLSACGGGGSPSIVVQITNVPGTLLVNQSVNISATVQNDNGTGGVAWSCSPSGSCGSFNPTTTANGGITSYTAPAAPGTVTITAAAQDHTSSTGTAMISVVPVGSNNLPVGSYIFSVAGSDSSGAYAAVGTIVSDGMGNISNGEQDYANVGGVQAGPDAVSGTYSVGANGTGSITLNVSDITLPNNGVETFSIATTSSTHALIIQFDGTATSSGTLDFQSASALDASEIAGSYAFAMNGVDITNQVGAEFGGVLNMSAASGGVTSGSFYANDGGTTQTSPLGFGPITGPDQFGRGTIRLTTGFNYVYYAVQGEVLRIIEEDIPVFLSSGSFYGQGTNGANGTFSNASLSGNYVMFNAGSTVNGALALGGQFNADGSGNLSTGYADTNDGGTYSSGSIAAQDVYAISGNGSGTLTLPGTPDTTQDVSALLIFATDPALNLYDPNSTGGGGGALLLDFDTNAYGTGLIVPQTTGTFSGNYAVNLQYFNSNGEEDIVGQSAASGSVTLTGTVDLNDDGTTAPATTFAGTAAADSSNAGRFTGTYSIGSNNIKISYFQVSSAELFTVVTDSSDVGNGFMEAQ